MKKLTFILITILGLGFLTSCNKTPEQKANYIVEKIEDKLDLNETQKAQLKKIADKGLNEFKAHKKHREELVSELKVLVKSDKISEVQARELIQKKKDRKEEVMKTLLPDILDFHATLNNEQKEKVVKFINKMDKKFKKHWD